MPAPARRLLSLRDVVAPQAAHLPVGPAPGSARRGRTRWFPAAVRGSGWYRPGRDRYRRRATVAAIAVVGHGELVAAEHEVAAEKRAVDQGEARSRSRGRRARRNRTSAPPGRYPSEKSFDRVGAEDLPEGRADRPAWRDPGACSSRRGWRGARSPSGPAGKAVEREKIGFVELGKLAVLVGIVLFAEAFGVYHLGDGLDHVRRRARSSGRTASGVRPRRSGSTRATAVRLVADRPTPVGVDGGGGGRSGKMPFDIVQSRVQSKPAADAQHVAADVAQDAEGFGSSPSRPPTAGVSISRR